ncbi:MAG: MFS transporter [Mycobacterium sp.]
MIRGPRVGLLVIVTVVFILSLDVTMLDIVLTDIGRDIRADEVQLSWLADCYNVAMAGLMLVGAGLGGRFGQRRVYLTGLAVFGVGCVLASVAPDPATLIAARTVMGVGAAGLSAPSVALTGEMFPGEQRVRALATWAAASGIGLSVGPILGGAIMSVSNWRWIFIVLVPLVLAAFVAGRVSLPAARSNNPPALDLPGAVLSALALIPLVAALLQVPDVGWSNPVILAGLAVGIGVLAAFARHETRTRAPMIDLTVLRIPVVGASAIALAASYVGFLGLQFLSSVQLRTAFGLTPVQAGLALAPWAVLYWVGAQSGAYLASRIGPTKVVLSGLAVLWLAFVLLTGLSTLGAVWVSAILTMAGVGCGLITPVAVSLMLSATPESLLATSSGLSMVARFGGGAVGMAILASAAATGGAAGWGYLAGGALVLGLGVFAVVLFRRREPSV